MALSPSQDPLAYEEIVELFASGPNPAQIVEFRPSDAACQRVSELLEKNRQGTLTPVEQAELDQFVQVEHLMRLVKARAREHLAR